MSDDSTSAPVRRWVLQTTFSLLYTRLGFLHEAVGRAVYGSAWHGRRKHVVPTDRRGTLLDIGCGEGRLLYSIRAHSVFALGVEPSPVMARRARHRGIVVIQTPAQALPIRTGSIAHVVATYPGPWIIDPQTWDEIARVTVDGATVQLLLGGDIVRGRGAFLRGRLLRLVYGDSNLTAQLPDLGNDDVIGEYLRKKDAWGTAMLWSGTRASTSSVRSVNT